MILVMGLRRKVVHMFMVVVMLSSLLSLGAVPEKFVPGGDVSQVAQAATPTFNIGDYVQLGAYNNAPILWRVIHKDPTTGDPILFSDRVLSLKAFDASGPYHTDPEGGSSNRVEVGSNFYQDSNIRQWANSSSPNSGESLIDWIQNDPSENNLLNGENPYNSEKGFLADGNFSAADRHLIKPLTHKVLLNLNDLDYSEGGSLGHINDVSIPSVMRNYDTTAYYHHVTDKVFLLSVKQLKEWVYDNRGILGTTYHYAKPTAEAVAQSTFQDEATLGSENNWYYWLNTPRYSLEDVRRVEPDGYIRNTIPYNAAGSGFRPAMQVDVSRASIASGSGTDGSPYVLASNWGAAAPTHISLSDNSVLESSPVGTTVGTFAATDADEGDTFTYSLLSAAEVAKSDNASFIIEGTSLKTAEVFDADVKSSYTVAVRVTDGKGHSYEQTLTITVEEAAVKLSSNNKVITLAFKENIFNAATTNAAAALRSAFTYTTNANAQTPNYDPLVQADKIAIVKKNKLVVTLNAALESQYIRVKLANEALRDAAGNKTIQYISDIFAADKAGPTIASVAVSNNNKTITVRFSEPVDYGSTAAKAADKVAALKGAITLPSSDFKASIAKGNLVIAMSSALTATNNSISIAADALKDAAGNKNALASAAFVADKVGPVPVVVTLSANKVISLKFDENIALASTATGLRDAIKFATNGDQQTPSYSTGLVTADKVAVSKNTLVITLATPLSGTTNRVRIGADALKDSIGNKNVLTESPLLLADTAGPTIATTTKISENSVELTFNESVKIVSTATKAADQLKDLKSKISIAPDGNTYTGLDETDSIKFAKGVLTVTLATALSGANHRIQIAANALKDEAGVNNLATTSALIAADTAGPSLVSASIDPTNKIATLTFDEAIVNAAAGATTAAKLTALGAGITVATDGKTFNSLAPADKLALKGNTLTLTKASGWSGASNKVKIAVNLLMDARNFKSSEIVSEKVVADFIAPTVKFSDTVAPDLSDLTADTVASTSATLTFDASEGGSYLLVGYTVANKPDTTPTAFEVYWSIGMGLVPFFGSGPIEAGPQTIERTSLDVGVSYDFYVVLMDKAGNFSNVAAVNFTTQPD